MRILQRAVLKDLLWVFSGVATALTLLLVVVGVIGEATKSGLGPVQILQILPYIVPSLLPFTIPATFLLTVCVVYGRMSGDQEITAMKAAGINVLDVLWPAFVLGAMLSLGTLMLTDLFVPWARARIEHVVTTAMEEIFLDVLRAHNQFSDPARGLAIQVGRVDDRKLMDATFRYTLPSGQTTLIACRQATLQFDLAGQQVLLDLHDGTIETPGGTGLDFEHIERPFPLPMQSSGPMPPRNITIQNIRRELATIVGESERLQQRRVLAAAFSLSTGSFDELLPAAQQPFDKKQVDHKERRQKLTTELHSRIALACSCFFFGLVGSPFAILQGKRQFLTSFALCFIPILLLYYPSVLLSMNLAREGVMHPAWGMWIGNAGLTLAAAVIMKKVLRH
ncbi:MAG: YjgP/YjgQ family permease [Planctomycetaceae bacterium]|nr:YjgP/YjgQ family permease [Planctomycetaceae bacterium]